MYRPSRFVQNKVARTVGLVTTVRTAKIVVRTVGLVTTSRSRIQKAVPIGSSDVHGRAVLPTRSLMLLKNAFSSRRIYGSRKSMDA